MELLTGPRERCSLEEAYARCEALARRHYENFTVGSWLLPRKTRKHIYAIYAFCRFVDDLGDEVPGDRLRLLELWEADLRRCYEGTPYHPFMIALQNTIHAFDIPVEPFLKLIQANRMDQTVTRHPSYQDLLYYCDHSANPVGHLFLYLFGYRDKERQRLADCTCTALQLTNFWQDIPVDWRRGRIYIPLEDMQRFGYTEEDLAASVVDNRFRELMAFELHRTRELFKEGLKLVELVDREVKVDILLFSRGGMKLLEAIERQGCDVFSRRPTVSKLVKLSLLLRAWVKVRLHR